MIMKLRKIHFEKTFKIILQTFIYHVILIPVLFERVNNEKKKLKKVIDITK